MHYSRTFPRSIYRRPIFSKGVALHRRNVISMDSSISKPDAYTELIHLALEVDPSLAPLAAHHQKRQPIQSPGVHLGEGKSSKAPWLRQRAPQGAKYLQLKEQLGGLELATVCEEAQCPNIGECWNGPTGTATIMIMGDTCTRGCRFCAVNTAQHPMGVDPLEPEKTAEAVASWNVGYIVLTSVDRDDLEDGGAGHFAKTVREIKKRKVGLWVECLTPDFAGHLQHVALLAKSGLDVFAHNLETVERLQRRVRDPRANYFQSLSVLEEAKRHGVVTKSSLMLGLGESDDEIIDAMLDLRHVGVDILTLGQYLQPKKQHLPVVDYVTPEAFEHWKKFGEDSVGFKYVASGPLIRSSYRAGEVFIESILKQKQKMGIV